MSKKGSFTVEACILVPFLLLVTVVFIYLGIYVFDKTLMEQDLDAAVSLIRDECMYEGEDASLILESFFRKMSSEHPYLAISNMKMSMDKKGEGAVIIISGEWGIPVLSEMNRTIEVRREMKNIDPLGVMLFTDSVKLLMEEKDENQGIVRNE